MDQAEPVARLRLLRTLNIDPMTYGLLMWRYGSATDAVAAIPAMAKRGGRHICLASLASAKAELELIDAAGAILLWRDSEYNPDRLAQYDDAPACFTAKGNLHLLNQPMIAIVGARNASITAQRHAQKMAAELGQNGYIIVSGMARGIDTAAHRGALPTGTIGVVAGGVDMIHLLENADLFDQVAATGLLLAEMQPSAPEWTDGMRQTIDQPAVNNLRKSLLRDLSFDQVTIDNLIGWYPQPAPVVCAAILDLEIAGLVTRHYGNRVAHIASQ